MKRFFRKYLQTIVTLSVVVIAIAGFIVYRVEFNKKPQSGYTQLQQVTSEVGKLMYLPTGENPTLATITNISKLTGQAIFAHAQNGDKVLVYSKASQIIVYRPSSNKIVAVGPLILGKNGSPYVTSTIAILNGSGNTQALSQMTESVTEDFPNSTIVEKNVAPRTFPGSIVIDLTGSNQPLDEQIADSLGIKSGELPLGITAPSNTDFLIIIGTNYK